MHLVLQARRRLECRPSLESTSNELPTPCQANVACWRHFSDVAARADDFIGLKQALRLRTSRSDFDPRVRPLKATGGGVVKSLEFIGSKDRWASFIRKKFGMNTKSPPKQKGDKQMRELGDQFIVPRLVRVASIPRVSAATSAAAKADVTTALMNVRC